MEKVKLGKRILFNLILFGFMGQVAWAVENVYFNTFLYNFICGTPKDISVMVACSAVAAVVTTFIMGTLSDKLNRRKVFICAGYILWGITVAVFALISRENIARAFSISDEAKVIAATVSVVIIMDCVMTFMGSTANDAAFNAWVTDVTVPENRGTAEAVLATLPILATLIVTVGFGAGVSAVGYPACFIGLGIMVTLCGIIGLFSVKDSRSGVKEKSNYFQDLIYGFRPSVVRENSKLYLSLTAACMFNIAVQIFLPYLFIYLQHYLGFDFAKLQITPLVIVCALAALVGFIAVTVLLGKLIDRVGKTNFIFPSVVIFIVGLVAVYFAKKLWVFGLLALIMLVGYGLLMIVLNASVRDFTPEDKVGQFQGVRMIFYVLLPMVIGPAIGNKTIELFAKNYDLGTMLNDYGEATLVPIPTIFLAAAAVSVLIFIPLIFLQRQNKKR